MRKSIQLHASLRVLNVAFDVGKDLLTWETQPNEQRLTGSLGNTTDAIVKVLKQLERLGKEQRYDELRIICESTGVYHRALLRLASQRGMRTALAAGEAVAKMRTIESNDPNKSDEKDPGTILAVAKIGKLLWHRLLDDQYAELRELHGVYKAAEEAHARCKTELHHMLKAIIPDLQLTKHALFGPGGLRMLRLFRGNPVWIAACGSFEGFVSQMKEEKLHVQTATLRKIWEAAESSVKLGVSPLVLSAQSTRVGHLYSDLECWATRLEHLAQSMVTCYRRIQEQNNTLPQRTLGVLTELMAARLIAETGPLSDFSSFRQLLRYAGLNLCERKSGVWRGKTKISRRGRANLRHVLNLWALSLVSPGRLYATYYRRKRDTEKMPGTKAMVCVMRKSLKMLYGWSRSGEAFDQGRVQSNRSSTRTTPTLTANYTTPTTQQQVAS